MQESELISIILYLLRKYVTILIKSVVNKNKNEYYYNIFLDSQKYKSNTKYF